VARKQKTGSERGEKGEDGPVRVKPAAELGKVARRVFPGPAGSGVPLRVHFARRAYAELVAHAKDSVDAEVGGVLVGETCEDDEGPFLEVQAVIRAMAAREGRAHVTFTHETWTQIHATLDRTYPDLQIVGWYHTHPGFGVEFSAMDLFIQQNFFSGPTQIAFLTDPLGGETAICWNGPQGIASLPKFWVDGREHAARVPGPPHGIGATAAASTPYAGGGDAGREIERLEGRINHLIRAMDEQRANFHRMLVALVIVVCAVLIGWIGYQIWADRTERLTPPKVQSYVPVPVKVGDETVMLGVAVVDWAIPPRLDAYLEKVARLELEARREQEETQRKLQEKQRRAPKK
jgi:proteasome lid subunit RPN8/RPN11